MERMPSSATSAVDPARKRSLKISSDNTPSYPLCFSAPTYSTSGNSPCPGMQRKWRLHDSGSIASFGASEICTWNSLAGSIAFRLSMGIPGASELNASSASPTAG